MANKIKYGIQNVYYAVATIAADGSATYTTPVRMPGAVSLTLDPEGSQTTFHADNVVYWVGNANNGYTGSLELARVPESFYTDVLGEFADSNNVTFEEIAPQQVHFALLFQFEGDEKETLHVMYNCVAGRPSVAGSTKEDSIEPQTETLELTATSVYNDSLKKNLVKAKTNDETGDAVRNSWFTTVYQHTATT